MLDHEEREVRWNHSDRRAMLQLFAKLIPIEIVLPTGPIDLSRLAQEEPAEIRSGHVTKSPAASLLHGNAHETTETET